MSRALNPMVKKPTAEAMRSLHRSNLKNISLSDENIDPIGTMATGNRTPLTPVQNTLYHVRNRLENMIGGDKNVDIEDKTSPGLARLRNTPGRALKDKQKILNQMHQDARNKVDKLNIGGGVSLWPEMTNMRLTKTEVFHLIFTSVSLALVTLVVFTQLHGALISELNQFTKDLKTFPMANQLNLDSGTDSFTKSLLSWHENFFKLNGQISERFEVNMWSASLAYWLCIALYVSGILTLLYYLMDSMFTNSRLTPRRIKIWVNLLAVLGVWTLLILYLLSVAKVLEDSVTSVVQDLHMELANLVYFDLDLTKFNSIRDYWTMRYLMPSSPGTLSIVGIVPIKNIMLYLQYYSLPVLTALLTPVIKLCLSLKQIYTVKRQ